MNMPLTPSANLWSATGKPCTSFNRFIADIDDSFSVCGNFGYSKFIGNLAEYHGLTVIILTRRQRATVAALIALDGVARRLVLCPPDLSASSISRVMADCHGDIILSDTDFDVSVCEAGTDQLATSASASNQVTLRNLETSWVLFTSGTTGHPKMIHHTLRSLTGATPRGADGAMPVWSTFYDIRRYGGLQILLRVLLGNGSMVLSDQEEPVTAFLHRAGQAGVTHISGTPSHWRRALMSGAIHNIAPEYIRLSGEIADQPVLDELQRQFPGIVISHAFASTEAGVAFDVEDGMAGFPADWIGRVGHPVDLRVQNGTLLVRSERIGRSLIDGAIGSMVDQDGFIDTGDIVERHGERYHFVGRREGRINVGGLKVYPEEVEAVINHHPCVSASSVFGRNSPITGAIVCADVVIKKGFSLNPQHFERIKSEIMTSCKADLPAYKVPAFIREVLSLDIALSGKLLRRHA